WRTQIRVQASGLRIATTQKSSCLKRATFSSTNFENILTWETEADIPPGTVFDVQYKQYGEKSWLNKRECQSITQLFCNLTHETENFMEHYYARVRATGRRKLRDRMGSLRTATVIGAPEVEYIPYVRSIKFLIHPPYTPLRGEDDRQLTIEDVYSKFGAVDYHLTIFNQRTHQKVKKITTSGPNLQSHSFLLICFFYLLQQDFRGISSFQPLTLTVEHIIKPINLSKPSPLIPDVQLPQISQYLHRALEPPWPFCPPEAAYQQQVDVPTFRLPTQPPCLASTAPAGYAPQAAEPSVPTAPASNVLPLTYGMCVEGTDHVDKKGLQPSQMLKEVSPDSFVGGKLLTQTLGKSCSCWNYKEQRPNLAPWDSSDTRESGLSQGSPGQTPHLLLQTDGVGSRVHVSQLSLSLLEQEGCYRRQTAELPPLLSSVKVDTDSVAEDESLPPLPATLLFSVSTGNSFPGENVTEGWMLPDSFSQSVNKLQLPETQGTETLTAAENSCTKLSNGVSQDTTSDPDSGTPLTLLFKDLDLKVLWHQDEDTECY
uniref:Interleukin 22 receptor subunit alpha 1 n=1 Tax=Athene cunicularia TaxID=194338 RepID=A0A663N9T8_ATHCN